MSEHHEDQHDDGHTAADAVQLIVIIAALVAVAGALLTPRSHPPAAAAAAEAGAAAHDGAKLHVVRLIKVGPRTARVLLDGDDLGELAIDAEGKFSGWAIGKLRGQARRLSRGRVELHPDGGLPEDMTPGLQRLLTQGGVLQSTIVAPEPTELAPGALEAD